ncbi:MAG: VWA domain-containing protein, partial [Candidatus Diapherotrites archaeon]
MKRNIFAIFAFFTILIIFQQTPVLSKDVELYINNEDADTKDTAVVLYGPGTFTLTGKIKNNLSIYEERKKIDLVFILDASGSMSDEIAAVKNNIVQIIDQVNTDCPDCMRVGLYVFEGGGSTAGFISKPSYCHSDGDRGAIHLTSDGQKIKNLLGQINATCSVEPWCALTIDILNDSNFGWRNQPDVVKAILVITDEPADPCGPCNSASCHGYRCAEAGNKLLSENAYFFGIVGTAAPTKVKADMDKVLNVSKKGTYYDYTGANQIPAKIVEAIKYIMGQDDFVVSRQEGPNWDNIGSNFEI